MKKISLEWVTLNKIHWDNSHGTSCITKVKKEKAETMQAKKTQGILTGGNTVTNVPSNGLPTVEFKPKSKLKVAF